MVRGQPGYCLADGIGHVNITRPTFHGDLSSFRVQPHDTEPSGAGVQQVAGGLLIGVGRSVVGDFVVEAIELIPGVFGAAWFSVLSWFKRFPPAEIKIGDRGNTKRPDGVTVFVNAMMEDRGQVLIAGIVKGKSLYGVIRVRDCVRVCGQPLESMSACNRPLASP